MTKMADGRAGVPVSKCDSYKELELYLEKVSEEFGEVFERWLGEAPKVSQPPVPPIRTKRSRLLYGDVPLVIPPPPMPKPEKIPVEWSDTVMHDFDRLIAQELSQLQLEVEATKPLVSSTPESAVSPVDRFSLGKGAIRKSRQESLKDDSGLDSGLVSAATQTSPTLSRSSSFTWRSDCSSSFLPDGTSSSSPSPSSSTSTSPCPLDDSIDSSPEASRLTNLDGYLPIRKKKKSGVLRGADVWIRRESVHTQTVDPQATSFCSLEVDETASDFSQSQQQEFSSHFLASEDTAPIGRPPVPRIGNSLPRPARLTLAPPAAPQMPSPTSASLKLSAAPLPPELASKSSSAPAITKKPPSFQTDMGVLKQPRSQSERHVAEIEAEETCKWLRAAGFPQYAQLFEDSQFPIDVASVQKDHPFLDKDSLRSLFRRLHTLNRCARLKVDSNKSSIQESDEEELCALSENWTFQPELRRWSRLYEGLTIPAAPVKNHEGLRRGRSLPPGGTVPMTESNFQRTGSERLREGAKALLRKMEGLKGRRRRKSNKEAKSKAVENDSQSYDSSLGSSTCWSDGQRDEGAASDSGCPAVSVKGWPSPILGTRSLPRPRHRQTTSPTFQSKRHGYADGSGSPTEDSSSTVASQPDSDMEIPSRPKCGVVRWHSLRRPTSPPPPSACPQAIGALSAGQLLVLRKLSLLKLTACMEKHCPPLRSNWTWDLPRFIRKIKSPDYKGKRVFGVPLSVIMQRSGQALPEPIQGALRWLRTNALEQVGLFRKSGVRSRIHALRVLTEEMGEEVNYDGQQAYDVADMVKQYLRELPESLFTNKLTDTFLSIFQHIPAEEQAGAVQWAIILLPDEHREALQSIVDFLHLVAVNCASNQMTASNLAVCLAPTLFHLHSASPSPARAGTSPRRKKQTGVPDQRELGENKAAHDCLLHLILHARTSFEVPDAMLTACRFSSLEASVPMTLKELGQEARGWRGFMQDSTHAFLKEVRERSRGWIACTSCDPETELSYKKVRDGHPLRLWRTSTDVEAPPTELLQRILRERHVWDPSVLQWRVVARLDTQAEVFQFVCSSMAPLPAKDYCVLRTWKADLPRGGCVVVETSVEHPESPVPPGAVRGVVLASRYLIRPCGGGRTRVVLLTRVDTKGRSPEWYNKTYGLLCAAQLSNLRLSFVHSTEGPESKV